MKVNQTQHGGARKGAGRPFGTKRKEKTTVLRVPVSLVSKIKDLIDKDSK